MIYLCCEICASPFLSTYFFLCFLQAWADAFRSSPDLTGVVQVYEELKRKGIEFPMSDLETLSPIHTPHRVGVGKFSIRTNHSLIFNASLCVVCRQHLLQRVTPLYISTAALLNPQHTPSPQPTPPLRFPTSKPLDLLIPPLNR